MSQSNDIIKEIRQTHYAADQSRVNLALLNCPLRRSVFFARAKKERPNGTPCYWRADENTLSSITRHTAKIKLYLLSTARTASCSMLRTVFKKDFVDGNELVTQVAKVDVLDFLVHVSFQSRKGCPESCQHFL
jgi:hypothetical protein